MMICWYNQKLKVAVKYRNIYNRTMCDLRQINLQFKFFLISIYNLIFSHIC